MRGVVGKKAKRKEEEENILVSFCQRFFKEVALLSVASYACKLLSLVSRFSLRAK